MRIAVRQDTCPARTSHVHEERGKEATDPGVPGCRPYRRQSGGGLARDSVHYAAKAIDLDVADAGGRQPRICWPSGSRCISISPAPELTGFAFRYLTIPGFGKLHGYPRRLSLSPSAR